MGEFVRRASFVVRRCKHRLPHRLRLLAISCALIMAAAVTHAATITVGSKSFTENYLLAEIFAQWIEANTEHTVERRFGLDTKICFDALRNGEIDLYPEYTGTIKEVFLKSSKPLSENELATAVQERFDLRVGPSLGFNNTYVLAIHQDIAGDSIRRISDLRDRPELRVGLSHQFLEREDGWPQLSRRYQLPQRDVVGVKHALAYDAIASGDFDITDAYSTDGKLDRYPLTLLEDDLNFFPQYLALPFLSAETAANFPELNELFTLLGGSLSENSIRSMNAAAETRGDYQSVAREFLEDRGMVSNTARRHTAFTELWRLTREHLTLTGIAVFLALLVGIPLGIICTRVRWLASGILALVGLLQTIPSIALLAFMIPLLGIGTVPAITALFLYGLLPIVRNTYTGIHEVSPVLNEVADGIGLTRAQRLRKVELPLALPFILAGVKICTVVSIGTATLAAFIGAGGYGEPIVTGLAMNDSQMILRGAIPAAVLAIIAEYGLRALERRLISPGLIQRAA